jgi:hypothetical protein
MPCRQSGGQISKSNFGYVSKAGTCAPMLLSKFDSIDSKKHSALANQNCEKFDSILGAFADADSYFKLPPYIESPTVFSWAFFVQRLNGDEHLRQLPCDFSAIKKACFWPFPTKITPFFSLFSVTLVTFHKATFYKINDLRGGDLQVEIGGR